MKQAILLHGTGGSDKDYFWFGDLKKFLEDAEYRVWWPLLPHTERPTLEDSFKFVMSHMPPIDENTIIIGHSSGCPLALYLLEKLSKPVKQVILVAGFYQSLKDNGYSDLMLPDSFDWDNIKTKSDEIILINSDNDPWGCGDEQARPIAERLDAKFILAPDQGHMGSTTFDQPYREFPLLKEILSR